MEKTKKKILTQRKNKRKEKRICQKLLPQEKNRTKHKNKHKTNNTHSAETNQKMTNEKKSIQKKPQNRYASLKVVAQLLNNPIVMLSIHEYPKNKKLTTIQQQATIKRVYRMLKLHNSPIEQLSFQHQTRSRSKIHQNYKPFKIIYLTTQRHKALYMLLKTMPNLITFKGRWQRIYIPILTRKNITKKNNGLHLIIYNNKYMTETQFIEEYEQLEVKDEK